ncbi:MAG: 23S rRNA (guanosine(2251)-2'-O)-methyltransferase RlmB [Nitrospirota bacterium]
MRPESDIVYGVHPVLEMLKSGRPVGKIYLSLSRSEKEGETIRLYAREKGIPLAAVSKEELSRMTATTRHQGAAAFVSTESYQDLNALLAVSVKRKEAPFFLLLDSVEDPRNLGAILRTAEAACVHGVILPKRRAASLSPVVGKTSAGAMAHLPITRVTNLSQTIDQLKKENISIVGMDATAKMSYLENDFQSPVAIVVGGEGGGIHQKILERCDAVVSLPMRGKVSSLNVSVAVGIVTYEVLRQRGISKNKIK